jgi:hypothetical protein
MGRRRTIEDRDRDAKAVELRRRHLNYPQIAAQMGYKDPSGAYHAVQRGLQDATSDASEEVKRLELDRLDDIARGFQRVFATRHYAISLGSGKVVLDPSTGQPLVDDGPVIQAGLALIRVMERRAKYLGLDAPAQSRVQVISEDTVDAEIRRLEARLPANDRDHSGTAR